MSNPRISHSTISADKVTSAPGPQRIAQVRPGVLLVVGAALIAWVSGCDVPQGGGVIRGETMGTSYTVKISQLPTDVTLEDLSEQIEGALLEVNQQMSTYLRDSELTRFNEASDLDWIDVSPATAKVVQEASQMSALTGGAFDPTVSPWVDLWSFGPDPRQHASPSRDEIEHLRPLIGVDLIEVRDQPPAIRRQKPGVRIDLSGIAKGYAVDRLAEILASRDVKGYMIEIGGEVRADGVNANGKPWRIGIESPTAEQRQIAKVIELQGALATSGDYRNFFVEDGKRYSHLIDPRSGLPIDHRLVSVSVLDDHCIRADALATSLMVMGPDEGFEFANAHNIPAMFWVLDGDGEFQAKKTPGFSTLTNAEGQFMP